MFESDGAHQSVCEILVNWSLVYPDPFFWTGGLVKTPDKCTDILPEAYISLAILMASKVHVDLVKSVRTAMRSQLDACLCLTDDRVVGKIFDWHVKVSVMRDIT